MAAAKPANRKGEGRHPDRDPRPTGIVPGQPYRGKAKRRRLELDDATLKQILNFARRQMSKNEAAGCMGVSRICLVDFLEANEEALEAWEIGRQEGMGRLRSRYYEMAMIEPQIMKHAAKHYLGMEDKPQAAVNVNVNAGDNTTVNVDPGTAEVKKRVVELLAKLRPPPAFESHASRAMNAKDITPPKK